MTPGKLIALLALSLVLLSASCNDDATSEEDDAMTALPDSAVRHGRGCILAGLKTCQAQT